MAEKQVIFMALFKADCYKRFNWWNKGLIPTMESAEAMMSATIRLCTADLVPSQSGWLGTRHHMSEEKCCAVIGWFSTAIITTNSWCILVLAVLLSCAYRGATGSRGSCTNYIWWFSLELTSSWVKLITTRSFFHSELVKSKKPLIVVFYMINFITRVLLKVRYI